MRVITPYKFFADCSEEWLSRDVPAWFKNTAGSRQERPSGQSIGCPAGAFKGSSSVRLCPSFVELFKNTLVLRLPTDVLFVFSDDYLVVEVAGGRGFLTHEHHDLKHQMDESYGSKNVSIKFDFECLLLSESSAKCIVMPPEYHFDEETSFLKTMIGHLSPQ